jgi:hypothetical protein
MINLKSKNHASIIVLACSFISICIGIFWFIFGATTETILLSSVACLAGVKLLKGLAIIKLSDKRSKLLTIILIGALLYSLIKLLSPLFF